MSEESDLVAKIITNDINTLVEDLNNVIKAHNVLVDENQQLKDRINKAVEYINWWVEDNKKQEIGLTISETDGLLSLLKGDKE